ncbi:hypothetical protein KEM54_004793 [Ascosphaera aggregata]|nr:hypothetical protein KEM54_004793 [Ascosphaera aggregata]
MEQRVSLGAPGAPGAPPPPHGNRQSLQTSGRGQLQPQPPQHHSTGIPNLQPPPPPPYDVRGVPIVSPGHQNMTPPPPPQQQQQQRQQQHSAPPMPHHQFASYTSMSSEHMSAAASGMPQGPIPVYTAGGMMGAPGAGVGGSGPSAGTVTDDHYASGMEDSNDAKRRRIARVEKKRNPPKGAKYIEGLENRLSRMESLLRLSGLLSESDFGKTDLGVLEKRLAEKSMAAAAAKKNTSNLWSNSSGAATPAGLGIQGNGMPSMLTSPGGYAVGQSGASSHQSTPRGDHSRVGSVAGSPMWKRGDKGSASWNSNGSTSERDNVCQEQISDMMCSVLIVFRVK